MTQDLCEWNEKVLFFFCRKRGYLVIYVMNCENNLPNFICFTLLNYRTCLPNTSKSSVDDKCNSTSSLFHKAT